MPRSRKLEQCSKGYLLLVHCHSINNKTLYVCKVSTVTVLYLSVMAILYQFADQGPTLQCLHTPDSLIYAADTWSMTAATSRRLDAFDQWCLRRILRIPYTAHVTNEEVRRMQDWAATSHLYHRIKAITSVRTYRTS